MADWENVLKDFADYEHYARELPAVTIKSRVYLDALELLKEQDDEIRILLSDFNDLQKEHEKLLDKKIPLITNGQEVVLCKDCDNKECWGRAGNVVCGIDGTPHRPDWFCADGKRREDDD